MEGSDSVIVGRGVSSGLDGSLIWIVSAIIATVGILTYVVVLANRNKSIGPSGASSSSGSSSAATAPPPLTAAEVARRRIELFSKKQAEDAVKDAALREMREKAAIAFADDLKNSRVDTGDFRFVQPKKGPPGGGKRGG